MDDQELLAGFRGVAAASVADAVDKVCRRPGFMSSVIRPVTEGKLAGRAVTVLERASLDSAPPIHALEAIDNADPGAVVVIGMENPALTADVAVWGGLMTAAAVTRGLGGAVLDAALRDVQETAEAGFPIFARSVAPSTTVGRVVTVARGIPVVCGGVLVHPGDVIVADTDGVVVVPTGDAEAVLEVAREIEDIENRMVGAIREKGSIIEALREFGRI
jgi:4-hydroxy-4-methyl-2-oxoglutarate aldolase